MSRRPHQASPSHRVRSAVMSTIPSNARRCFCHQARQRCGPNNHLGNAESSELHLGLTASSEPAEPQGGLRDMSLSLGSLTQVHLLTNAGQSACLTRVIEGKSHGFHAMDRTGCDQA